MDRDSFAYLALHYVVLISLIFVIVVALDVIGADVPFWVGLLLAILIGFGYPRVLRRIGIAPDRWT